MAQPFELPPPIELNEQRGQTFTKLVELMQRLLGPGGCPWDQEQTPQSLRQYVLEEACEVMDAIDSGIAHEIAEELGDLALQIVFHSELGRAQRQFGPDDVIRGICEKLVRRHPHVFGDSHASDAATVLQNWDAIKAQEKPRKLLDGTPRSFPALARAERLGSKAAQVGFDWPDAGGSYEKVKEEIAELEEAMRAGDKGPFEAELGDLLFALVNLARHHGVHAEEALGKACDKFGRRFSHVEARVEATHGGWPRGPNGKPTLGIGLAELDAYWDEAKAKE